MIGTTKRLLLSLGCLLALALPGYSADPPVEQAAQQPPVAAVNAPDPAIESVTIDKVDYRLTGPFRHENLAVYLLHAKADVRKDEDFLTLDEGLRRKVVTVHEKSGGGSVQELIIENKSDLPLYLQEGDRLSGGQQDRTVQTPLVIKPHSGPQKLAAFCIEQSRWRSANAENRFEASGSSASAPRSVRSAAKYESSQGEVWNKVKMTKEQYALSFSSANTNSSLNESLDSATAKAAARAYMNPLGRLLEGKKDVVGVAFAVNGRIEEINVYAGHPLLAKMFPRLLESYAMEAAVARDGPMPAVGGKQDDRNEKVAGSLKKPLNTKYNGMKFDEVLSDLRTAVGVEFVIDWAAIEGAGVKRDKRIVVRVRNTPGDEVLRQVLEFAGGKDKGLNYTIADGKVHISKREAMAALVEREKQRQKKDITQPPPALAAAGGAPDLNAIAAFMKKGLSEAGTATRDRQIDSFNKLQIVQLNDRFFARSLVGETVVHRQWMRADKEATAK